uniref:Small ribosomal subunit protein uS12m n=1 Tax=Vespula pensylvanica TaxID=30213 RepID=A0A834NKZ9_VESPE|nr:hypothetical protein H0235_013178 [Vespula pensylvanica]
MNVLTRSVLNVARSFIGNSTEVNKFHVAGHYGNTGIQGGLVNNMRASLGNMLQELNESRSSLRKNRAKVRRDITKTGVLKIAFEQIRWKCSLQQLHKRGLKDKKVKKSKNPLSGKPFAKGVILRTVIKKPKKPNSANRKCVVVKLSTGKEMTAYVPGIGHNLQEHNVVLCRVGRLQDTPGVKIKCIRGKYDLPHKYKFGVAVLLNPDASTWTHVQCILTSRCHNGERVLVQPSSFDVITEGLHADFYASALSTFTHAGHCLPIDHMTS